MNISEGKLNRIITESIKHVLREADEYQYVHITVPEMGNDGQIMPAILTTLKVSPEDIDMGKHFICRMAASRLGMRCDTSNWDVVMSGSEEEVEIMNYWRENGGLYGENDEENDGDKYDDGPVQLGHNEF